MIVCTYPAAFGPECRAFTTRERAEQWAIQCGYAGRSTLYDESNIRLYRCAAYHRRCPLFPETTYRAGWFINDYHCRELLNHWSSCRSVKGEVRYAFDDAIDDPTVLNQAFAIHDHRDYMACLSRPEYAAALVS